MFFRVKNWGRTNWAQKKKNKKRNRESRRKIHLMIERVRENRNQEKEKKIAKKKVSWLGLGTHWIGRRLPILCFRHFIPSTADHRTGSLRRTRLQLISLNLGWLFKGTLVTR